MEQLFNKYPIASVVIIGVVLLVLLLGPFWVIADNINLKGRVITLEQVIENQANTIKQYEKMNYFLEENELTTKHFNLEELLIFQLKNDVQIIRGADYQYSCYINGKSYYEALTPLNALVIGIKIYKENES